MALVISDRIKETTNTVGTQTFQLEGAVTGFETFAANLSDGDTTYYAVTDNTNFEVGLGTINEGTSQTINYTVTVAANADGNNVFVLNGVNNPVITFVKGFTYVFDVSDNTNGSHPLRFRTSADASYTDGVSVSGTQGQANATVTIVVASDAPSTLKYYCTVHGNAMGNTINVISAVATLARTTILASSNSNNAVSFGSGAKTIFCTLPADKTVFLDGSDDLTLVGANGNIVFDKSDDSLKLGDDMSLKIGDGGDLKISHSAGSGVIRNQTDGRIYIQSDNTVDGVIITKELASEVMAKFRADGPVELYHNNSKKLETTSTGATLTGKLTADTIDSGDIRIEETSPTLLYNDTNESTDNKAFQLTGSGGILTIQYLNDSLGGGGGYIQFPRTGNNLDSFDMYRAGVLKNRLTTTGDNYITSGNVGIGTTSPSTTLEVAGDATISSTVDGGPILTLRSNDHSDATDFHKEAIINFNADNDADEEITFAAIEMRPSDVSDGTEDGRINFLTQEGGGGLTTSIMVASQQFILNHDDHKIVWNNTKGTTHEVSLTVNTPTASRTISLPDATGTVLTTGNSDTPTTTTSSSDADFVLIDDGGTMKKITPTNLGITAGAASLDDATALAIALG